ncbi:unnamed protein product, partial [Callosobruchus maculatus]
VGCGPLVCLVLRTTDRTLAGPSTLSVCRRTPTNRSTCALFSSAPSASRPPAAAKLTNASRTAGFRTNHARLFLRLTVQDVLHVEI